MIREEILPFLNQKIRLVKGNNFVLTGTILKVNTDSILFETTQAIALIDINQIQEIILTNEGK